MANPDNPPPAIHQEGSSFPQHFLETTRQLESARAELADSQHQTQAQRRRLLALHQRLKRRHHRFWAAERAALQRRKEDLDQQSRQLERAWQRLQWERETLARERLGFNGEVEIGRRQLQAARAKLRNEQQQWEEKHAREQAELKDNRRHLRQRETVLVEAERNLANLKEETRGLENRIRHQRLKMLEEEQEALRLQEVLRELRDRPSQETGSFPAISNPVSPVNPPAVSHGLEQRECRLQQAEQELQRRLSTLETLEGQLADQRLHLAEQCLRLALSRECCQQECEAITADLEFRDRILREREQELASLATGLHQRQAEVAFIRRFLLSWEARLTAKTISWQGERQRFLAELQAREESAQRGLTIIADWHQGSQKSFPMEPRLSIQAKIKENLQGLSRGNYPKLRQELQSLRDQQKVYQRQLAELHDLVERLAALFLQEDAPGAITVQAA